MLFETSLSCGKRADYYQIKRVIERNQAGMNGSPQVKPWLAYNPMFSVSANVQIGEGWHDLFAQKL